jgi:hypothetical protein
LLKRFSIRNDLQKAFKKQSIASGAVHIFSRLLKKGLLVYPQEFLPSLWRQLTPKLVELIVTNIITILGPKSIGRKRVNRWR